MASNVVFNGVTYSIPAVGDSGWGTDLTAYFISIASNSLQKSAGNFTITSELNLGNTYGVKAPYLKSVTASPALTGVVRLANTDPLAWRKADNSGDITLLVDSSNSLIFNGTSLSVGGTPVQSAITVSDTSTVDLTLAADNISGSVIAGSLTNSHINASAAIAYSKLNLSTSILNADVNASAAIAYSKLNLTGAVLNADISASAAVAYSKLNLAGSIVNADISASASIGYSKLNLATSIVNADISASAAIAYSKLSLTSSIVNADVSASAAIAYSKLNLSVSIVNADISSGAAIAMTKLVPLGNNLALQTSGIGAIQASTVTSTELGYLSGVTSAVQTQLSAKMTNPMTTGGDVIYGGSSGAPTRLANGASGTFLKSNGTTLAPTWSNPTISLTAPTIQKFTSGSGTYTTPAGVLYIKVTAVGGGSGGCGGGSAAGTAPGAGGTTTFGTSLISAGGGAAPSFGQGGGLGGTSSLGTAVGLAFTGGAGGGAGSTSGNTLQVNGPVGGASFLGGAGMGGGASGFGGGQPGGSAAANTGGGGGGAGCAVSSGVVSGNGGGSGGGVIANIYSPSSTYSYAVGSGGSAGGAGTGGAAGGAGGSGVILVEEYYQ